MSTDQTKKPLVYSCSGCSSVAQMANYVAVQLDRRGVANMSCISGVGGDVPALLKIARSGRPIVVIDGCPLVCAQKCLERHGIAPDEHVQLADHGVKKCFHADFDMDDAKRIVDQVAESVMALEASRQDFIRDEA
jgi:uncharacterized metal-binding protein